MADNWATANSFPDDGFSNFSTAEPISGYTKEPGEPVHYSGSPSGFGSGWLRISHPQNAGEVGPVGPIRICFEIAGYGVTFPIPGGDDSIQAALYKGGTGAANPGLKLAETHGDRFVNPCHGIIYVLANEADTDLFLAVERDSPPPSGRNLGIQFFGLSIPLNNVRANANVLDLTVDSTISSWCQGCDNEPGEIAHSPSGPTPQTVWHRWPATISQTLSMTMDPADWIHNDSVAHVPAAITCYEGGTSAASPGTVIHTGTSTGGAPHTFPLTTVAGNDYWFVISPVAACPVIDVLRFTLAWDVGVAPPITGWHIGDIAIG